MISGVYDTSDTNFMNYNLKQNLLKTYIETSEN